MRLRLPEHRDPARRMHRVAVAFVVATARSAGGGPPASASSGLLARALDPFAFVGSFPLPSPLLACASDKTSRPCRAAVSRSLSGGARRVRRLT